MPIKTGERAAWFPKSEVHAWLRQRAALRDNSKNETGRKLRGQPDRNSFRQIDVAQNPRKLVRATRPSTQGRSPMSKNRTETGRHLAADISARARPGTGRKVLSARSAPSPAPAPATSSPVATACTQHSQIWLRHSPVSDRRPAAHDLLLQIESRGH